MSASKSSFQVQQSELELEAFQTVEKLLVQWTEDRLATLDTVASPASREDVGFKLPKIASARVNEDRGDWRHFTVHKGTERQNGKHTVQFLSTFSRPEAKAPVPRTTAGVWIQYHTIDEEKRPVTAPAAMLTYRFEHNHLCHTTPWPPPTERPTTVDGPSKRLPGLLKSKFKVSDALIRGRYLKSKTWRDWAKEERSAYQTMSRSDHLNSNQSLDGKEIAASSNTEWSRNAMWARDDVAYDCQQKRILLRLEDNTEYQHSVLQPPAERPITAETLMTRSYLKNIAGVPPLPPSWNVQTRNERGEILQLEREKRQARRQDRVVAHLQKQSSTGIDEQMDSRDVASLPTGSSQVPPAGNESTLAPIDDRGNMESSSTPSLGLIEDDMPHAIDNSERMDEAGQQLANADRRPVDEDSHSTVGDESGNSERRTVVLGSEEGPNVHDEEEDGESIDEGGQQLDNADRGPVDEGSHLTVGDEPGNSERRTVVLGSEDGPNVHDVERDGELNEAESIGELIDELDSGDTNDDKSVEEVDN
ncbi:hypothetical protein HDU85_005365 [Gaertneriomyces sp. JEL0708]|nr:hypothetical protein HDU85_005365 [Gaertneriomyces sp. JEL0708]